MGDGEREAHSRKRKRTFLGSLDQKHFARSFRGTLARLPLKDAHSGLLLPDLLALLRHRILGDAVVGVDIERLAQLAEVFYIHEGFRILRGRFVVLQSTNLESNESAVVH